MLFVMWCVTVTLARVNLTFAGAVHRYYESRRRLYNDSRPTRIEIAQIAKRTSKKKEKRKRVKTELF